MEYPELIQATCLPLSDKELKQWQHLYFPPSIIQIPTLDGLSTKVPNLFQILEPKEPKIH